MADQIQTRAGESRPTQKLTAAQVSTLEKPKTSHGTSGGSKVNKMTERERMQASLR